MEGFFDPLKDKAFGIGDRFDYDGMKRWIEGQQWAFSKSITVEGDILSANWDGASPLDLSAKDTTATAGYALDTSQGTSQWMGNMYIDGDLFVVGSSLFGDPTDRTILIDGDTGKITWSLETAGANEPDDPAQIEASWSSGSASGAITLLGYQWESGGDSQGRPFFRMKSSTSWAALPAWFEFGTHGTDGTTEYNMFQLYEMDSADYFYAAEFGDQTLMILHDGYVRVGSGSSTIPAYSFVDDTNTGITWMAADKMGFVAGGGTRMFLDSKGLHTAAAGYSTAPWASNGIELGVEAYLGTEGSFKYGIHWNWERGPSSTYVNKGVNGYAEHGSVQIGSSGIEFLFASNASPTGQPTTIGRVNQNALRMIDGNVSTPSYAFINDINTGIYTNGSTLYFVWNGTVELGLRANIAEFPAVGDNTTGSAANVFISASGSHVMERSTSRLEYKPGWEFADEEALANLELPHPITWQHRKEYEGRPAEPADEKTGFPGAPAVDDYVLEETMLGFGVEHVHEMLPMAATDKRDDGEPDNYDVRALVAVLTAKVRRLEDLAGV